jgi:transposase
MAPSGSQAGFAFAGTCLGKRLRLAPYAEPIVGFVDPRGTDIVVNGLRLEDFLAPRHGWVIDLYGRLLQFDWSDFTKAYKPSGRYPIHPRIIVGLVIFGALVGCKSLRDLESLAERDLAAWFICGGLRPDHSTIGKVLLKHVELISGKFFEKVTLGLVVDLQITPGGKGAIDGTVIQAAASRFTTLSREAAREAAKEAQAELERLFAAEGKRLSATADSADAVAATDVVARPGERPAAVQMQAPASVEAVTIGPDTEPATSGRVALAEKVLSPELTAAIEKATAAQAVAEVAEARAVEREIKGRSADKTSVAPGEIDAVLQPLKRGGNAPAYKPSIAVHESGLIIAQAMHPSNETAVVPALRDQYRRVLGGALGVTLLDGNYHCEEILRLFVQAGEDVLCPGGHSENHGRKGAKGLFGKSDFRFEEEADAYRCPEGRTLLRKGKSVDRDGRSCVTYEASRADCTICPLHDRCTKTAARSVTRYTGDELKEGMQLVFTQPAARKTFKLRTTLAERPYAVMKERQGLRRFHRRGTKKVAMEFALHCVAYNIRCARSLKARAVVFIFMARLPGRPWRILEVRLAHT